MVIFSRAPDGQRGFWPGLWFGLRPLVSLIFSLLVWLAVLLVAQHLLGGAGFLTQRLAGTIILALALLTGATFFLRQCRRVLKQIAAWQENGSTLAAAQGALVALGVSAVVVALPVILGLVLPQHPAI